MKQKAKKAFKHKVQLFGKTVPTMILVGLLLAGTGSAALLTSFGTVSGDADVKQSVYFADGDGVSTDVAASFDGSLVAGQKTTSEFTLVNNASEEATVELVSDASEIEGISQTVYDESAYQKQSFDIVTYGGDYDSSDLQVSVTPSSDSVTYRADVAGIQSQVGHNDGSQLYFSSQEYETVPHVKHSYNPDGEGVWAFKVKSEGETEYSSVSELVEERDVIESASFKNGVMEVTVSKEVGYDQSFAFVDTYGQDQLATQEWASNPGNFNNDDSHESISYPNPLTDTSGDTGTSVTLPADSETDFQLATDFHVALDPSPREVDSNPGSGEVLDEYFSSDGEYLVDLRIDPVTAN